ncbi:MAG TPA: hypothetical protein VF572_06200 [Candidatus Saccharimonadales bacterium]|jgi:hypothetical protein
MAEAATGERILTDETVEKRVLTEVYQIRRRLQPDGSISPEDRHDLEADFITATQEMAIPAAVSKTIQRVATERDQHGRSRRVITWLGKPAIEVAMSGYDYYVTDAGRKRGDIEVAEARYSESNIQPDIVQTFISPAMAPVDASEDIAKAENLYGQDGVRVSFPVTDKHGVVIARRIESLLVSDVPLEAWTAMLRDPGNIFGRTIELRNNVSALSVMEIFDQLSLPQHVLPEGPVSVLRSLKPYIADPVAAASVAQQIQRFQTGQEQYTRQAEKTAREWLDFDIELARSLESGTATTEAERFIATLQHEWSDDDLRVIDSHAYGGRYIMTDKLAAVLEKAKQNILVSQAALATGNRNVLAQTDRRTAQRLRDDLEFIDMMRANNYDAVEIARLEVDMTRRLARQNFKVGGGCAGTSTGSFKKSKDGLSESDGEAADMTVVSEDGDGWTWKKGVCRIEQCQSPKPTEVGPCDVCRNCQYKYDSGQDPAAAATVRPPAAERGDRPDILAYFKAIIQTDKNRNVEAPQRETQKIHDKASPVSTV